MLGRLEKEVEGCEARVGEWLTSVSSEVEAKRLAMSQFATLQQSQFHDMKAMVTTVRTALSAQNQAKQQWMEAWVASQEQEAAERNMALMTQVGNLVSELEAKRKSQALIQHQAFSSMLATHTLDVQGHVDTLGTSVTDSSSGLGRFQKGVTQRTQARMTAAQHSNQQVSLQP